jgi:tRNA threonylcarbamoyladenosine biosynthesis protein TsaB
MKLPNILAIETATHACSVAILVEGKSYQVYEYAPQQHTVLIFPMIEEALKQANLTLQEIAYIAVGKGPGSFTGVRLGIALAQGLAYGLKLPLFGISTLEALALQAIESAKYVIPALDARMGEVYTGVYALNENELLCIEAEQVCSPEKLFDLMKRFPDALGIGSGWDAYHPTQENLLKERHPHALDVAKIAQSRWQKGERGEAPSELVA